MVERNSRPTAPLASGTLRQGEQALGRLGGGTRLSALAPHPTIDASTHGRGRIAHRSAELRYSRTAVGVVWITDEQCPFMPAKASPNHKLNALVDHEVGSGCGGTDAAVPPRRGAKDIGELDSLQLLTEMGTHASRSPRRLFSFQL